MLELLEAHATSKNVDLKTLFKKKLHYRALLLIYLYSLLDLLCVSKSIVPKNRFKVLEILVHLKRIITNNTFLQKTVKLESK